MRGLRYVEVAEGYRKIAEPMRFTNPWYLFLRRRRTGSVRIGKICLSMRLEEF